MKSPSEPKARLSGEARSIRNVILYYVLVLAVGWGLIEAWPMAASAFHLERLQQLAEGDPLGQAFGGGGAGGGIASLRLAQGMGVAALSMLGALVVMVPVASTYIVIKRRGGYDEAIVHTLLILPVAVTGIVTIVQNSAALAFSLAGIVAGVRFRTSLDDTKDAVYIFVAIGIGLAAGVQALGIAFVLSLVFNTVVITLWVLGFGNIYKDQGDRTGHFTLGDVLAGPDSAKKAVAFGDRGLIDAMTADEIKDVAERVARMERYLASVGDTKKERKAYSVLLVYTDQAGAAQKAVEPRLGELCVRWSLAEIIPRSDGSEVSVLEYLVRPKDDVSEGTLMEAVQVAGGDCVRAAEMRSLKAMAKRL